MLPANLGLENTLTAFGNAVRLGYTHLETDVHLTSDGRLVAFHDDVLDRVTDGTGRVADLPWATVRQARIGSVERVTLLSEVIDAFPGVSLNIDLKAPGTAEPVWRMIDARGLHDLFCVGSFSQSEISAFRRLAGGRVATAAAQRGAALMAFGPEALSRVLATPADVFQVPRTHIVRGRRIRVVSPKFLRAAHAVGKHVHVWTIDEAQEMHDLLDLGVDGLLTDRPDTLKQVLLERGSWTGR